MRDFFVGGGRGERFVLLVRVLGADGTASCAFARYDTGGLCLLRRYERLVLLVGPSASRDRAFECTSSLLAWSIVRFDID